MEPYTRQVLIKVKHNLVGEHQDHGLLELVLTLPFLLTDLSADPMILTFVYNKETSAPADAASGWYLDNVSVTEIPADSDGVIVEDGSWISIIEEKVHLCHIPPIIGFNLLVRSSICRP